MKINLNKIIKYLILSDLVFYTGWGLISPIFAIFILDMIQGGNAFVVGMAAAISLIVRSIVRIPFGLYVDKDKTQRRAYWYMVLGLFVGALIPFGFIFSKLPMHIYILQAIFGVSMAMSTAGWTCIFSRRIDKNKESTEWGVDAVAVGLGPGIAALVGGIAVPFFSFTYVFIAVALLGLAGVVLLL
ncbi:MAG: MFS transporter, partial [Nanoarchaeota archaeon]